jgi:hypothetical protein
MSQDLTAVHKNTEDFSYYCRKTVLPFIEKRAHLNHFLQVLRRKLRVDTEEVSGQVISQVSYLSANTIQALKRTSTIYARFDGFMATSGGKYCLHLQVRI